MQRHPEDTYGVRSILITKHPSNPDAQIPLKVFFKCFVFPNGIKLFLFLAFMVKFFKFVICPGNDK